MWKVLDFLLWTILFASGAATGEDQRGAAFMLSFIHPNKLDGNPILLISAERRASVTITIPSLDLILINDIEPGETWKPSLSSDLRYKSYFKSVRSAVNVTSTSPVAVYVYDGVKSRSSGYMALPLHALSTSYIAVTYSGQKGNAYPVFLLVAIMNDTRVDVLYRLSSGECDKHTSGQISSHTLHAYDVYGVRCTGDFTGTYIVSNKPLVVISGHQNTNISGFYDDTLQEMMIPVNQFGQSFVLIEPRGSATGSINRIVSSSDNTEVTSSTGETFLLKAYEYVDIDTAISGQQCINSNFPVLVVSFSKSKNGGSYDRIVVDAAMYIVPATNMFTTSINVDFGLASTLNISEYVSIAFVFSRYDTPDFSAYTNVHEVIPKCPYDVYTVTVTAWPIRFSGGSFSFGAYLYGNNEVRHNGVAFPLNMAFASGLVSASHLSLSTSESSITQPSSLSQSPGAAVPSDSIQSSSSLIGDHQLPTSMSHHMISDSYSRRTSSASINLEPTVTGQSSTTDMDQTSADNVPSLTISTLHSPEIPLQSSTRSPSSSAPSSSSFSSLLLSSLSSSFSSLSFPSSPSPSYPTSSFSLSQSSSSYFVPLSSTISHSLFPSPSSSTSSLPLSASLSPLPHSSSLFAFSTSSSPFATSSHGVYESSTPKQKVCGCLCKTHASWNITDELFEMLRNDIIDLLLLEPKNLSKTVRKLTSARDNRPSAVAIGSFGTVCIVLTIVVIFVPDVMSGLRYLFSEDKTHPQVFQFARSNK